MQNPQAVTKQFAHRQEPCRQAKDPAMTPEDFVRIAREQICKMRDEYALERQKNLQAILKKRASLSHSARQHLEMALSCQKAFERSAHLPSRCSDEIVEMMKRIDRPVL